MNKSSLAAAVLMVVVASVGTAEAGGQSGTIGVGAETALASFGGGMGGGAFTPSGASMNFDAGAFHVGGFLGLSDGGGNNDTNYTLAGRFFYHMHSTAMADFGLGGTLGVFSVDGPGDRTSLVFLEPGVQIRLFVASNVALSFTTGIAIGLVDADGFSLGGQVTGSAGVHYYFF